jgi:hypothetical protein
MMGEGGLISGGNSIAVSEGKGCGASVIAAGVGVLGLSVVPIAAAKGRAGGGVTAVICVVVNVGILAGIAAAKAMALARKRVFMGGIFMQYSIYKKCK